MMIRGKATRTVRTRLQSFCAEAGYTDPAWYVFSSNGQAVPLRKSLTSRRGWSDLRNAFQHGVSALIRVSISGATIRVKNNARVTYLDPKHGGAQLTAKIALASQVRSGSLAREIRARKLLARTVSSLPVPALSRYDRKKLRWLVEQYIRPADRNAEIDKIGIFFDRHASDLYAPFVRSRPISKWLKRRGVAWTDLQQVFRESGIEVPDDARDGTWPVSLLHGDLSPGNMIAGRDNQLYLIDWEKSGVGPLAWDLKKLALRAPDAVEKLLGSLSRSGDIAPTTQMRIAGAMDLILRRRERAGRLVYMTSHLGKSREEAAAALEVRERDILRAIARSNAETATGNNGTTELPDLNIADLTDALQALGAYSRVPERLQQMYPELISATKEDRFGTVERLAAIQEVLQGYELGNMIDLGGNAGYFSLSLVDCGMAAGSIIYDHNPDALAAGRLMARKLGLQDKVAFVQHTIDLEFLRILGSANTIICLNIIHHAGAKFDVEAVLEAGWESYARQWLLELRSRAQLAILGLGFKSAKPRHWNIAADERAKRFYDLAREAGWHVAYDANVEDLQLLGTKKADGLRTRNRAERRPTSDVALKGKQSKELTLRSKYHIYILQSS